MPAVAPSRSAPILRTLADFKRFLAEPGATLERDCDPAPRLVVAVKSKHAIIDPACPSRLDLDPAWRWFFDGCGAYRLYPDGSVCISYRCDYAAEVAE